MEGFKKILVPFDGSEQGIGSETVAHTQIIDLTTGTIILEVVKHCNYTDPVYQKYGTK